MAPPGFVRTGRRFSFVAFTLDLCLSRDVTPRCFIELQVGLRRFAVHPFEQLSLVTLPARASLPSKPLCQRTGLVRSASFPNSVDQPPKSPVGFVHKARIADQLASSVSPEAFRLRLHRHRRHHRLRLPESSSNAAVLVLLGHQLHPASCSDACLRPFTATRPKT